MPLALEWRETARRDLLAIIEYISNHNPAAAQRLKDEIEAKAQKLRIQPRLYRIGRVSGTRELVLKPRYILVFRIGAQAVTVLRILHAAQQWPPLLE